MASDTNLYVRVLEHRVAILEKRVQHVDIEIAHARESRDSYKGRLMTLLVAMKSQGIELVVEGEADGTI